MQHSLSRFIKKIFFSYTSGDLKVWAIDVFMRLRQKLYAVSNSLHKFCGTESIVMKSFLWNSLHTCVVEDLETASTVVRLVAAHHAGKSFHRITVLNDADIEHQASVANIH